MKEGNELRDMDIGTFKAVPERKSLGQHVFENLKQAIIRGEVSPGKRLVESRIADALGISRTPVREAIHKLEREGLLEKLPRGGFSVMGFSREDIEETFGIRSVLESYAARLAAIKHRKEELNPLEEKINEYQTCLDLGHLEELPKINTEFHDLLYALSRSPKLIKMINDLKDQIYRFRQILLNVEGMARISNEDHLQMLKAIKEKDAARVERLVREHILRGQGIVLKELKRRTGEF
ncbi:MAG: GntR family transcriptional regulator [Desulfatiglandales bacterium]